MSSANANSSRTSKKGVKIVGGPLNVVQKENQYVIEMNPEHTLNFSIPMEVDLTKQVGTYTKVYDKNGNIKERLDEEKGIKFVNQNGKIKRVKLKVREEEK